MGRLIDADALYTLFVKMKSFGELTAKKAIRCVEEAPTVDAEPVIRCKDCKWCETFYHGPDMGFSYECTKLYLTRTEANDFCSKAERKE